ncbi:hypothetical protein EZJ49_14365 [Bdellovibrio bacteriovorus]|uniref:hypothetical protein n=1 Tax=Bdellovibrio bacteriovorus TaxID=959 RepID=UPI0021D20B08|nr:hypothetical protein [Bdellovibrio bacteriovorus]UXR64248.1 hypothetical protein EZJ49_14365 [Bdellovibrio bacteriovorus]
MERSKTLEAISIGVTLLLVLAGTVQAKEHRMEVPLHGLEEKRFGTELIYHDEENAEDEKREVRFSWTETFKKAPVSLQVSSLMNTDGVGAAAQLNWAF